MVLTFGIDFGSWLQSPSTGALRREKSGPEPLNKRECSRPLPQPNGLGERRKALGARWVLRPWWRLAIFTGGNGGVCTRAPWASNTLGPHTVENRCKCRRGALFCSLLPGNWRGSLNPKSEKGTRMDRQPGGICQWRTYELRKAAVQRLIRAGSQTAFGSPVD
jgi:hypothetical protein